MTDHVAIGVLSSLIHRDVVDDVIRDCGKREQLYDCCRPMWALLPFPWVGFHDRPSRAVK